MDALAERLGVTKSDILDREEVGYTQLQYSASDCRVHMSPVPFNVIIRRWQSQPHITFVSRQLVASKPLCYVVAILLCAVLLI